MLVDSATPDCTQGHGQLCGDSRRPQGRERKCWERGAAKMGEMGTTTTVSTKKKRKEKIFEKSPLAVQ